MLERTLNESNQSAVRIRRLLFADGGAWDRTGANAQWSLTGGLPPIVDTGQVLRALLDPAAQYLLFVGRQRLFRLGRHFVVRHQFPQDAFVEITRCDDGPTLSPTSKRARAAQIELSLGFERTMTFKTSRFQKRQHVVLEVRVNLIRRGAQAEREAHTKIMLENDDRFRRTRRTMAVSSHWFVGILWLPMSVIIVNLPDRSQPRVWRDGASDPNALESYATMEFGKDGLLMICHVTLATRDVPRSVGFFQDTLGWQPIARPGNIGTRAAWLEIAPGLELHLIEDLKFEPSPFEQEFGRHIAVARPLAEFPQLQVRLQARGATLIAPIRETPFARFFFRDPNGYVFEVVEENHDEPRPVG